MPSLAIIGTITKAATGSAHHQPSSAFSRSPARRIAERYVHSSVCLESAIQINEPHTPDIYIGRVFDRNWELLSPVLPMSMIAPLVQRHFERTLSWVIEKNLSRLATQWDESIRGAMAELLSEAYRRIDELVATVGHLLSSVSHDAPRIRDDLDRLKSAGQLAATDAK